MVIALPCADDPRVSATTVITVLIMAARGEFLPRALAVCSLSP
jgi:hypothetical protein